MSAQIFQALASGFSAQQVIDYIIKKFPQHAKKISKALQAGYKPDDILNHLGGMTEFEQARKKDIDRSENINKAALTGAGIGAAAIATPIASRVVGSALSRALPHSLSNLSQGIQSAIAPSLTNLGIQRGQQSPVQPPITPPTQSLPSPPPTAPIPGASVSPTQAAAPIAQPNTNISQTPNIQQPQINVIPTQKDEKRLEALKKFNKKAKKKGILDDEIERFEKEYGPMAPEEKMAVEAEQEPIELPKEEKKPIAKKDTVITPQGIGEVREIKEKSALINVDGKLHKVSVEELETPEFTDDEIADAYDNLMAKIPEEHKSGFISWAGYDEDRNVLGFIPRGGKYEELTDITPEEAQKIKEGKGIARTTGETREGLWVMGEDTRGGIISQIIHDRRKKHKAQDEKQLKLGLELPKKEKEDRGMKPLFDEMSHARNLSRERERRKKLEEKQRLKREKDEAKKRKK